MMDPILIPSNLPNVSMMFAGGHLSLIRKDCPRGGSLPETENKYIILSPQHFPIRYIQERTLSLKFNLFEYIWWHTGWSTLVQVMACCLKAPSHYLKQG